MENFKKGMGLDSFKLLTKQEVADHLRLRESTVTTYRKEGKLKAVDIGSSYLFLESEIIRFIQEKHQ